MRSKLILIAILAVVNIPAMSQEKKPVKKQPPAQKVAPEAPVKPYLPEVFQNDISSLPRQYSGVDVKRFFELFDSRVQSVKKGEYETTEAFNKRTADVNAILSPISTGSLYAFEVKGIKWKYDADTQSYILGGDNDYQCESAGFAGIDKNVVTCRVGQLSRKESVYEGSNAYGAKKSVIKIEGTDIALGFNRESLANFSQFKLKGHATSDYKFSDRFSMPLEKAQTLKDSTLRVLFVGNVIEAKTINGQGMFHSPTMSLGIDADVKEFAIPFALRKIIYYVVETGEILDQK